MPHKAILTVSDDVYEKDIKDFYACAKEADIDSLTYYLNKYPELKGTIVVNKAAAMVLINGCPRTARYLTEEGGGSNIEELLEIIWYFQSDGYKSELQELKEILLTNRKQGPKK